MPAKVVHQGVPAAAVAETAPVPAGRLAPASRPPVEYPSSDGKRMADSVEQETAMTYAGGALRAHFGEGGAIFVAVDLLVYYVEWKPKKCVAPDVMVVRGVPSRRRGSYRAWEEGKAPDFVLEVLSDSTHEADEDDKRKAYAGMGVRECFLYDPLGRIMAAKRGGRRLQGMCLEGGAYREIPFRADGSVRSEVLGLDLRVRRRGRDAEWRELRFRDPAAGEDLPTYEEWHARWTEANRQA